ncbi:hypothetical protein DQ04_01151160 [Trypanosoma grayi]|uniref:hypothetical protein n=1 Tax=Trypanosoma grayi TaxID=71804 RepID=UPI0004F426C5|nr:hypothetical protein DQ04_01151160 [Trypanosoma grayi]KEG13209.1 hypothetical protein DQ04_01151160 [Trypanosoma grayi]
MTFYGLAAGCATSLVLYAPNWYQREDDDQKWCDEAEVREYYQARQQLLDDFAQEDSAMEGQEEVIPTAETEKNGV